MVANPGRISLESRHAIRDLIPTTSTLSLDALAEIAPRSSTAEATEYPIVPIAVAPRSNQQQGQGTFPVETNPGPAPGTN